MELTFIQRKIYEIRGQRVMQDRDLAEMYGVETRVLNQAVRRNIKRFEGEDFMFELSPEELSGSQIVILNKNRGGNFKYMPLAFTELGVSMLSSVLRSETAIEINRSIMRAFIAVRQLLLNPPEDRVTKLETELRELKIYIDDVFADNNDINEDTRMQIELFIISTPSGYLHSAIYASVG